MTIPPLRLTRAHLDKIPARTDERGPILLQDPDEAYFEDTATSILARLDDPDALWVFASGSLIWNPRMGVLERRPAEIQGFKRAFCITDKRFRGSPSKPGRMMALDRGGACRGVAQRMDPGDDLRGALIDLLKKEPPVPPALVTAQTPQSDVQAIVFAIDESFPLYSAEPDIDTLADNLASSVGFIGTMAEYLLNTVTELEKAGIHDPHLWRLQELVAERLDKLDGPVVEP